MNIFVSGYERTANNQVVIIIRIFILYRFDLRLASSTFNTSFILNKLCLYNY
jgi:hypothetical protein